MTDDENSVGKEGYVRTFKIHTLADLEELPELDYLIEEFLPVPVFGVLFGAPASYKSFTALSMSLAIANGDPWLGRNTRQGKVLYISGEGERGLWRRVQAYRARFPVNAENFRLIGEAVAVRDEGKLRALVTDLAHAGFKPDLIVVDTLSRAAVGADENSARDMGQVVEGLEKLKREIGATVLVIHHTRKNDGTFRGSSALEGAADVMISCEKVESDDGLACRLKCEKMKDDEPFKDIGVQLKKVELADGKSSLVVVSEADVVKASNERQDEIVELLKSKFAESGATHKELLEAFDAAGYGKQKTFNRAWSELKKSGRIATSSPGRNAKWIATNVGDGDMQELREVFESMRASR